MPSTSRQPWSAPCASSPTRFEAAGQHQEAAAAKRQEGDEIDWSVIPKVDDISITPGEEGDPPPNGERIPIISDEELERLEELARQMEWKASFCDHRQIQSVEDGVAIIDHTRAIWEIDDYIHNSQLSLLSFLACLTYILHVHVVPVY